MANTHLVTGYAGKEHIKASDWGSYNAALMGGEKYILDVGKKFAIQIISNTQVRIQDGDYLIEGRHGRIDTNKTVDINIDIGEQGKRRKDLICLRYEKDNATGIEQANLVIKKGESSETEPQLPQVVEGSILNGDLVSEMGLYELELNGLNLTSTKKLFTVVTNWANLKKEAVSQVTKVVSEFQERTNKILEGSQLQKRFLKIESEIMDIKANGRSSIKVVSNQVSQEEISAANDGTIFVEVANG